MGVLNPMWNDDHLELFTKYQFFLACVINQLLWGYKSWAIIEKLYNKIDSFLHRSIGKILWILRRQVSEDQITNAFIGNKLHFGHYKLTAHSKLLSEVHALKLSLIIKPGSAPDRIRVEYPHAQEVPSVNEEILI